MLRRFQPYLRYLKAEQRTLVAAIFYGLLFGATNGLGLPTLIKYVFPTIFDRSSGSPLPLADVILIAGCVPMLFLLRAVTSYLNSYYVQLTGVRILESVRLDFFRKLQLLPLSFLQRESSGDLLSRGIADSAQLQSTLTLMANDGVKQPMALVGALAFLVWQAFSTDGAFTVLVCLALVPLTVLPVHYVGRKVVRRAQQAAFEAVAVGVPCQEVDRAARAVIRDAGYGEFFIHRVGHGIGVTTHEPPYMVEGEEQPIETGMCFSIARVGMPQGQARGQQGRLFGCLVRQLVRHGYHPAACRDQRKAHISKKRHGPAGMPASSQCSAVTSPQMIKAPPQAQPSPPKWRRLGQNGERRLQYAMQPIQPSKV